MPPLRAEHVSLVDYKKEADNDKLLPVPVKGTNTHVVYTIEIEWGGGAPWQVNKRYSEFEAFQKRLVEVYGQKQVPSMPKKKKFPVVGGSHFIEKRMRGLELFLREVIGQCTMWFVVGENVKVPDGPAAVLGINPYIFEFLDFEKYAVIAAPAAPAVEGAGFFVHSVGRIGGKSQTQERTLELMSGSDLEKIIDLLREIDITDDDRHVDTVRDAIADLKAAKKTYHINTTQARDIVQHAFFQEVRMNLLELLVPLILDPENYRRVLLTIDFDDDIRRATKRFQDARKKQEQQMLVND